MRVAAETRRTNRPRAARIGRGPRSASAVLVLVVVTGCVTTAAVGCSSGDDARTPDGVAASSTSSSAAAGAVASRDDDDLPTVGSTTTPSGVAASTATAGEPRGDEMSTAFENDPTPDFATSRRSDRKVAFPVGVTPDGGTLADADGRPIYFTGDAAWSLIVQLDALSVREYLTARREMGFDALLVNLIEHQFANDPPRNADGIAPFRSPGDFADPEPAYFDYAHHVIEQARDLGFVVLLVPAYLGYDGGDQGWYAEMVAAGREALYEYGLYVGAMFADLDNIIWIHGGDFTPPPEHLALVQAIHDGIVDAGARQIWSAHWAPETSAADVPMDGLDVNATYTYREVYERSVVDDGGPLPHFVLESKYEDDAWDDAPPERLRAQMYHAMLTGAAGSIYGHGKIWKFTADWRDALHAQGATEMSHLRAYFDGLPWPELEPDIDEREVIRDVGDLGSSDVVVAAATPDRSVVVAYVPARRDVVVELGDRPARVSVRWFDPTTGRFCPAAASLDGQRRVTVTHPGANADGADDWVLDLRAG